MGNRTLPADERLEIIAAAKQETLAEIVKKAKTIEQLDEVETYDTNDKVEISNSKSIKLNAIVSLILKTVKAELSDIFQYNGKVAKYAELPVDAEVGNVYLVEEAYEKNLANTCYAYNGETWDVLDNVFNADGYLRIEDAELNYVKKIIGKELIATEKIAEIDALSEKILNCIQFTDLGSGRKCIVLNNNDLIVGTSTDGVNQYNLIMLSQYDTIDVGTSKLPLNLNTPKGKRVTVQEDGQSGEEANEIAYLSDVKENKNFIGKSVNGAKLFALTTESSPEDIKAALTNKISGIVTEADLDYCLTTGRYLKDSTLYQPILIGFTGQAWVFTQFSMINPTSEMFASKIVIKIDDETGEYKVISNGKREQYVNIETFNALVKRVEALEQPKK